MARFLLRPLGQRLPSRSWSLENGQRVHVRFEPTTTLSTDSVPTIKFVWLEPHKGPEGIHVARLSLFDFSARINGADDQGDDSVSISAQDITAGDRVYLHLSLLLAWRIKKAADQHFVNLRR